MPAVTKSALYGHIYIQATTTVGFCASVNTRFWDGITYFMKISKQFNADHGKSRLVVSSVQNHSFKACIIHIDFTSDNYSENSTCVKFCNAGKVTVLLPLASSLPWVAIVLP